MCKFIFGIILGYIASLIGKEKGHKTFGWLTRIWSTVYLLMLIMNICVRLKYSNFQYDLPNTIIIGIILIIIAICMKDLSKPNVIFCPKCGRISIGEEYKRYLCLDCKAKMKDTSIPPEDWLLKSEEEKSNLIKQWGISNLDIRDYVKEKLSSDDLIPRSKQSNCAEENPTEGTVLCCPKCGRIVSSFGASKYTCSKCGHETEMVKTNVSAKDWISKNEEEKKKILKSVNIIGITTIDYVQNKKGTIIDCKNVVPTADNTLQVPIKIVQIDDAILYCRNCGKKLDDDSLFCSYCGTKIR